MSLEQRVVKLEKARENRKHLPVMVCHRGTRDEALSRYLKKHGREPETEIEIHFFAPKVENL